jgi:hypothetical protein
MPKADFSSLALLGFVVAEHLEPLHQSLEFVKKI